MKKPITLAFLLISSICISQTIYFQENFDDCTLPADWTVEKESNSIGWTISTSNVLSSEKLIFPEKGSCFIGINDHKWDDENGDANNAVNDYLITPFIDFAGAKNLIIDFDYISGYSYAVFIEFRTENSDWKSTNVAPSGGVLKWQDYTVQLFGGNNVPILDVSEPIQFRFKFSDHGFSKFLGFALDDITIYESVENDLTLANVHIPEIVPIGSVPIVPLIFNRGVNVVQDIQINWQIDDLPMNNVQVEKFHNSSDFEISYIYPYGTGVLPVDDIYIDFESEGEYTLKVWVDYIGNTVDENTSDNYWEKSIAVKAELPQKYFLYEKFSHNLCSPCYEADLFAHQLEEENDNIYVVSVHSSSNDPMDYPEIDILDISYSQRAHPGTIMDRRFYDHLPHGRMSSLGDFLPDLTTPWWSPVEITFTEKVVDLDQQEISLKMEATFYADVEGDYRFNIMTLEDNIMAYQSGAPEGNNYIHNHVLRYNSGGNWGAGNSLPAVINQGETYDYEVTIDIHPDWDVENLSFIGVIQHFEKDNDNREIINAMKLYIDDAIVTDVVDNINQPLNIYPNPTKNFIYLVSDNLKGKDFQIQIFSSEGKLYKQESILANNKTYQQIDVRTMPSGHYFIQVLFGEQLIVKSFTVID